MGLNIIFSHHKCLSTWLANTSDAVCRLRRERFGNFWRDNPDERDWLFAHNSGPSCFDRRLPPFRGVHVVRDPRDIVVSGYFSHRYNHGTAGWPELLKHRARLEKLDLSDGLAAEIEFLAPFFRDMDGWPYGRPEVLELHAESIMRDDEGLFFWLRALDWFGIDVGAVDLARAVDSFSFSHQSGGRDRGDEDRHSHLRKGSPGDWKNYLQPRHLEAIESHWGDLVRKLGYANQ